MKMTSIRVKIVRRLLLALSRLGIADRIAVNVKTWIGVRAFRVPVLQGLGIGNLGATEPWMMGIFNRLAPPRTGVFLDVGANIGQTLLKVRSCWPETPWVGLEPNPTCLHYLRKLIEANSFTDCNLVPVGLHTEVSLKALEFFYADETDPHASLVEHFRPGEKVVSRRLVPTLSYAQIEAFVPRSDVSFVKIDVEGGEKEVIETLRPVLQVARPPILMEILPVYSPDNTWRLDRQRASERVFRELGYQLFRVEKTAVSDFVGLRRLEEIGVHGRIAWSDYLAVPGSARRNSSNPSAK